MGRVCGGMGRGRGDGHLNEDGEGKERSRDGNLASAENTKHRNFVESLLCYKCGRGSGILL